MKRQQLAQSVSAFKKTTPAITVRDVSKPEKRKISESAQIAEAGHCQGGGGW